VCREVWDFFEQTYGGGPPVCRLTIDIYAQPVPRDTGLSKSEDEEEGGDEKAEVPDAMETDAAEAPKERKDAAEPMEQERIEVKKEEGEEDERGGRAQRASEPSEDGQPPRRLVIAASSL